VKGRIDIVKAECLLFSESHMTAKHLLLNPIVQDALVIMRRWKYVMVDRSGVGDRTPHILTKRANVDNKILHTISLVTLYRASFSAVVNSFKAQMPPVGKRTVLSMVKHLELASQHQRQLVSYRIVLFL